VIASVLIIVVSGVLFVYWFRYTVLFLLKTGSPRDYASQFAAANGLKFIQLESASLKDAPASELQEVQQLLERDYRLLKFLLDHTSSLEVGGATLEQRLLMLDFKLMQLVCTLSRVLGIGRARAALAEMTVIVSQLANAMGERAESANRA